MGDLSRLELQRTTGEGSYLDDKKSGTWLTYYESGKIMTEIPFVNGQRHGTARAYNKEGKIVETLTYDKGKESR